MTASSETNSSWVPPRPRDYFLNQNKDVWSMINETAAAAEKESGKPVINLGQGFFSYSPPKFAIDAAKSALDVPALNQYAPTRGRASLRQEIAKDYAPVLKRDIDPDTDVVITAGANEGILSSFFGFLNPQDEVIVFEPFFDQYISNIELAGGKIVYVPLHPPPTATQETCSAADWTFNPEELSRAFNSRTKMIVINTPHNPLGKVFSESELRAIGDLAIHYNTVIVSDEVYHRLHYKPFVAIASLSPRLAELTLTVGSAGKTFAATGWRVGWVIGNKNLIKYVAAANTRIVFSVVSPLQEASAQALIKASTNSYYKDTIESYNRKYKIFTKVFDDLRIPYTIAEGGYFLLVSFAKVKIPTNYKFPREFNSRPRDFAIAYWLIKELGVVAIPPTEFYIPDHSHMADTFLRFAVCKDDSMLQEAAERLYGLKKYLY